MGSQVPFEGRDTLIRIGKQEHSIIKILQKASLGESRQWDWRSKVREKMKEAGPRGSIKELREYALIKGEL